MLKKKIMSVIVGATMLISQAANFVLAAEQSTIPWGYYSASASTWDDVSTWHKLSSKMNAGNQFEIYNEGHESQAPIIRMYDGYAGFDEIRVVPTSDAKAVGTEGEVNDKIAPITQTNRGSLIISFTVPYSGDWNIDADCISRGAESGTGTAGYMELSVISGGVSADVDGSETAIPGGAAEVKSASLEKEIELVKGEIVALKVKSTSDSYGRNFAYNYVISDANNPSISFNALDGGKYVSVNTQKAFNPSINAVVEDKDTMDAAWDVKFAQDTDWVGDEAYTIANWKAPTKVDDGQQLYTIEGAGPTKKSIINIHPGFPNGTFRVRPAGATSTQTDRQTDFYNSVIEWTAPQDGDYVIEFKGKDTPKDGNTTTSASNYVLANSNTGDVKALVLDTFTVAGSASGAVTEEQWMYSLKSGEKMYLIIDEGTKGDAWGDDLYLNYKITDTVTGKEWDFAKYKNGRLENSDFSFMTSNLSDKITRLFYRNSFGTDDAGNIVSSMTGEAKNSYITIYNDGTMGLKTTSAQKNLIAFDAPETGYYKVDLVGINLGTGSETGTELVLLKNEAYGLTIETAAVLGSMILKGENETNAVSKVVHLNKNDRIWLTNTPQGSTTGIDVNVKYNISIVENFDVTYKSNAMPVYYAADVASGAALSADVVYVSDTALDATVVLAGYDSEGKMVAADMLDTTFAANSSDAKTLSITLAEGQSIKNAKVFIIESMDTMIPVTGAIELQ